MSSDSHWDIKLQMKTTGVLAISILFYCASAVASPQRLDCVLTDTPGQPASESRTVVIVFDETANSLAAQVAGQNYNFTTVSISNVSISAQYDDISLGLDRSGLGLVWQKYGTAVSTEYGKCQRNAAPAAEVH